MGLVLEWVYGTIVSTAEKARDSAKKALGAPGWFMSCRRLWPSCYHQHFLPCGLSMEDESPNMLTCELCRGHARGH